MRTVTQRHHATVEDAVTAAERAAAAKRHQALLDATLNTRTHGEIDPTTTREQRALNALDSINESLRYLRSFTTAEQAFADQELVEVANVLDNAVGALCERFGG